MVPATLADPVPRKGPAELWGGADCTDASSNRDDDNDDHDEPDSGQTRHRIGGCISADDLQNANTRWKTILCERCVSVSFTLAWHHDVIRTSRVVTIPKVVDGPDSGSFDVVLPR